MCSEQLDNYSTETILDETTRTTLVDPIFYAISSFGIRSILIHWSTNTNCTARDGRIGLDWIGLKFRFEWSYQDVFFRQGSKSNSIEPRLCLDDCCVLGFDRWNLAVSRMPFEWSYQDSRRAFFRIELTRIEMELNWTPAQHFALDIGVLGLYCIASSCSIRFEWSFRRPFLSILTFILILKFARRGSRIEIEAIAHRELNPVRLVVSTLVLSWQDSFFGKHDDKLNSMQCNATTPASSSTSCINTNHCIGVR
jgi:hypothetical protein